MCAGKVTKYMCHLCDEKKLISFAIMEMVSPNRGTGWTRMVVWLRHMGHFDVNGCIASRRAVAYGPRALQPQVVCSSNVNMPVGIYRTSIQEAR